MELLAVKVPLLVKRVPEVEVKVSVRLLLSALRALVLAMVIKRIVGLASRATVLLIVTLSPVSGRPPAPVQPPPDQVFVSLQLPSAVEAQAAALAICQCPNNKNKITANDIRNQLRLDSLAVIVSESPNLSISLITPLFFFRRENLVNYIFLLLSPA